jgi:hypothetical protein
MKIIEYKDIHVKRRKANHHSRSKNNERKRKRVNDYEGMSNKRIKVLKRQHSII